MNPETNKWSTDRMPILAHFIALFSSLELLLDVLRGSIPAHTASGRFRERGQDIEMVLPARLAHACAHHNGIRLQQGSR